MVKTNGADGSSIKNAIIITETGTQKEAYQYISNLAEKYMEKRGFSDYIITDIKEGIFHSGYAVITFSLHGKLMDALWIEISSVFESCSGWQNVNQHEQPTQP